ncbi:MAG: hypothetical protein WBE68_15470 [Candidatus Nitrosopolaris sp.]|jgi:hypothetical protein
MSSDPRSGLVNVKEQPLIEGEKIFPKKVAIVFLEHTKHKRWLFKGSNLRLDFDQVACALLFAPQDVLR